jgi:putative ABC transport system permease protein
MRLAWRELRRRPSRFVVAALLLTFMVLLLLFLGGLLDGLYRGSTGAIRAQQADVIVYSQDARESFLRSRITPELRAEVEAVSGSAMSAGSPLVGARPRRPTSPTWPSPATRSLRRSAARPAPATPTGGWRPSA